ncbi:MAG: hypothetical protein H6626_03440 [Pseudobdellovibrionaceae bacterium]|nr:hypothetical protein [Bdellovibrionales bacterium]USN48155.1 MAG: hypothetical protein H6626_03440 [Pseudobdellovibrionaceae bacterium]
MDSWEVAVFVLHLFSVFYMTGIIWFIQRVHYPLMAVVPEEQFVEYENRHTRLTGPVVAPVMVLELLTGLLLLWMAPFGGTHYRWLLLASMLLVMVWLVTFGVSVPLHKRLSHSFEIRAHSKLVSTNWVRTLAWTGRAAIFIYLFVNWQP